MNKKKKTHVLIVANNFMKAHPRAGESTGFPENILNGNKIHTIRGDYNKWKKKVDEINAGDAVLSIRRWSGTPYNSNQVTIKDLHEVGIERMDYTLNDQFAQVGNHKVHLRHIWSNDGLSQDDFKAWFKESQKGMAIIHFTKYKYVLEMNVKDISVRDWEQIKGH